MKALSQYISTIILLVMTILVTLASVNRIQEYYTSFMETKPSSDTVIKISCIKLYNKTLYIITSTTNTTIYLIIIYTTNKTLYIYPKEFLYENILHYADIDIYLYMVVINNDTLLLSNRSLLIISSANDILLKIITKEGVYYG